MIPCWPRILHLASVLFCMTVHPVAGLAPWPTSPRRLPPTYRSSCLTASVPCSEASGPWLREAFWQLVPASVDHAWDWNVLVWSLLPCPFPSHPIPTKKNELFWSTNYLRSEPLPGGICPPRHFLVGLNSFMVHGSLHVFLSSRFVTNLVS